MDGLDMRKVAVLGAGVMGAQIAAHCANAGLDVLLFDIVPEGAADRDAVARSAIAKLLKADPAPFMSRRFARRITPCNLEDHLDRLRDCDWVVEAVIERLDVKHGLYRRLEPVLRDDAILSSNTSTLPRAMLVDGMGQDLRSRFLITHFFNPPRYMRLLEVLGGTEVPGQRVEEFRSFAETRLGKNTVMCRDTPGFIANRIGTFWIQAAIAGALDHGLSVVEADAVMGRPFGFPKTGVFGLVDLVGVDLIPYVDGSLAAALPEGDFYHRIRRDMPLVQKMIAEGYTGRKGKGGFYRLNREHGGKVKEAIDLGTGTYSRAGKPALASIEAARSGGAAALIAAGDRGSRYAADVMGKVLAYAATIAFDIADDIASIDEAMRLGYNWKKGPFELIDQIGAGPLSSMLRGAGLPVPPLLSKAVEAGGFYAASGDGLLQLAADGSRQPLKRRPGVTLLADVKRGSKALMKNGSASLWDLGDGVFCFEVHTKLNTIDKDVIELLARSTAFTAENGKAMVIYNEGSQFSAGANLGLALFVANLGLWQPIDDLVDGGQKAVRGLKYAPFPVVSAPSGLALGGGCEFCLAADAIVAHAETYIGLVETGVGLVPAWGGCAELLVRLARDPARPKGPVAPMAQAFQTIGLARVAKSAFEAKELGFLAPDDTVVFHRDQLLTVARKKALELAEGYAAPEPPEYRLAGAAGQAAISMAVHDLDLKGMVTPHDHAVVAQLAQVLSGGEGTDPTVPMTEADVLALERAAFMHLVREEATLERMEHTLATGKPLRN
ncbi:MAG: 3-hydroxyacyl-CoA dehydrogenase NAD-binding domain-containing protein [Geminicoccaceae bacterium]